MSPVGTDRAACFRCGANPAAPGGDACFGCRRFLAGYTDVDPKDTPPRSERSEDQADYVIALASARGFEVTRDELERLQARRDDRHPAPRRSG